MSGRYMRSTIAELVSEVIGSRQGRAQLSAHGWIQGMPIVIAQPGEPVNDVMSLVAAHQPPVLIATLDPENNDLWFLYVAIGCNALKVVDPLESHTTIAQLYKAALGSSFLTFRIKQMPTSSMAHAIEPQHVQHHAGYPPINTSTAGSH